MALVSNFILYLSSAALVTSIPAVSLGSLTFQPKHPHHRARRNESDLPEAVNNVYRV
jgi:hypothetical protein